MPSNSSVPPVEIQNKWARRRDIPIAILAWTALVLLILWGARHIFRTILILTIAALIAYALTPLVRFFQRFMPRKLAILLVYLVVFSGICLVCYFVTQTAVDQAGQLAHQVRYLLTPRPHSQNTPLEDLLVSAGIPQGEISAARGQVISHVENLANTGTVVPFVTGFFNATLDTVLIGVLSVYILIDGSKASRWLRQNSPRPARIDFILDTLQRIVGGYIRGQVLLAFIIGMLVGGGMAVFGVPYALLLGVLAFVLEFIPVLGTLISGAICTLIALTQGWVIAVCVLAYFILVHVLEGDIIGPRIVGQAIGLHPVVAIAALVAGSELFGIWGALFASPVAGVLQALLIAIWTQWRTTHPEQFKQLKTNISDSVIGADSKTQQLKEPEQVE
ncbi:MAG TPA: AI-2E family transporter [Dictyobacter sp.]|jgi:predicted PurR-regulated permease PerM|nr:AI-2E family transporter [Dictyobacter sp.]